MLNPIAGVGIPQPWPVATPRAQAPPPAPAPTDSYAPMAPIGQLPLPPLNWQDRVLTFLPVVTLPVPGASAGNAAWGDRLRTSGGQVFRWLQGSAGSLYQDAAQFFTGNAATPPGWLNPAHYPTTNPLRQQVVAIAERYLGVPYVWGGTSPKGFDCSGLVQYVYNKAGVALPRTAAEQFRVGIPIFNKADLQPGDAIFLRGTHGPDRKAITHVGLYIGNGKVLAAPYTGAKVRVESLDAGTWVSHYAGARRYIA